MSVIIMHIVSTVGVLLADAINGSSIDGNGKTVTITARRTL